MKNNSRFLLAVCLSLMAASWGQAVAVPHEWGDNRMLFSDAPETAYVSTGADSVKRLHVLTDRLEQDERRLNQLIQDIENDRNAIRQLQEKKHGRPLR